MNFSFVALTLSASALALPFSIAASNSALGLLIIAVALRWRSDGRRVIDAWRRESVLAALAFYVAAGLTAALLSAEPAESLRDAFKDCHRLASLSLFVAALALEPETPLRVPLGASFSAMALVGLWQSFHDGTRAHAFVHPVVYGEQMALAVLGGLCVLLLPTPRTGRRGAAAFTSLAFTALVMSQTRMALLAAAAGFAAMALLEPRARRWALPALLLIAAVAASWELLPGNTRTLSSVFKRYDPSNNQQQSRLVLWDVAWRMFRDHPLVGAGPGGYGRLFADYHAGALEGQLGWGSAHNLYLHQFAERGLLGGLALLVLLGTLLSRAVRAARAADARSLWPVGAVAALLAMCLTETAFQNEQFATLFLLIWAWGTTALRANPENL
jgi:O-antigen ligase